MGHSYVWKGGSGSLALAADWTDQTTGGIALAAPGSADTASLVGAAAGLLLASGTLTVAALFTSFGVALSGSVAANTLTVAGTVVLEPGAKLHASLATVTGALAEAGAGATLLVGRTLTLSGTVAAVAGGGLALGALALAGGTLSLDPLSTALVGSGTAAAGRLTVAAGAAITGTGAVHADGGTIALAGTIAASGGALALFGAAAGSGTLAIGAGATLFAAGAVGSGLTAAFAAPAGGIGGTLELFGAAASFGATITGFAPGDAIEIASDTIKSATWANGVLTLTDTAGTALALAMPDGADLTYDAATFLPLPDGLGGTAVLVLPPATAAPTGNITYTVPAGAFQLFAAGAGVSRLVTTGTLAVTAHTASNSVSIAGTLAAVGRTGVFSGLSVDASGLLIAAGAHAVASVTGTLSLSGTFAAEAGGLASANVLKLAGGALTLDAASFMTLGGATAEAGRIALAAGATLAGWGRISASLDDAGVLLVQGGTLLLAAPAGGTGAVQIGAGATLAVFSTLALPVAFGAAATLQLIGPPNLVTGTLSGFAAGDALDIAGARIDSAAWSAGTLSLTGGGTLAGTLALAGAFAGLSWQVAADDTGGTLVSLGSGGGRPLHITGTLAVASSIAAPSATANAGALVAMQGGTLAVATLQLAPAAFLAGNGMVGGAIANAGTLTASGGALLVAGPISGSGMAIITATGTLFAEAGFIGTMPVAFQGTGGTLALFGSASAAPGPIAGFAIGDGLDIAGAQVLGATWAATSGGLGTLDLTGPGGDLGSFSLVGNYAGQSFLVHPDGGGGTVIHLVGGTGGGPFAPAALVGVR